MRNSKRWKNVILYCWRLKRIASEEKINDIYIFRSPNGEKADLCGSFYTHELVILYYMCGSDSIFLFFIFCKEKNWLTLLSEYDIKVVRLLLANN